MLIVSWPGPAETVSVHLPQRSGKNGVRPRTPEVLVATASILHSVRTTLAKEGVVSVIVEQAIGAALAVEGVIARAPIHLVSPGLKLRVPSSPGIDSVVSSQGEDAVGTLSASNGVRVFGTQAIQGTSTSHWMTAA